MCLQSMYSFHVVLGYVSGQASTACQICPAGYACPDVTDPTKNTICDAGKYSIAGQMDCTSCPDGSYCPSTM